MYLYGVTTKHHKQLVLWVSNKEQAQEFHSQQEAEWLIQNRVFNHDVAVIKV